MDSKIEITPCREDFAKTDEDKKRIRIQGAGFDFTVSKDPHGRSSCGCMQRMLAVELGPYRFYKCRKCGAKIVVRYDTGITVEADIQGVTADDVAKLIDAVMAKHWEGDQDEGSEEDDPTIPPVDDYSHKIYHRMVAEVNKQMRELLGHCP